MWLMFYWLYFLIAEKNYKTSPAPILATMHKGIFIFKIFTALEMEVSEKD